MMNRSYKADNPSEEKDPCTLGLIFFSQPIKELDCVFECWISKGDSQLKGGGVHTN